MGNSLPPHFIPLAPRKIALRLIILSSLFSFVLNVILVERVFQHDDYLAGSEIIGLSLIPVSVWLHHILRLWPREKWSVRYDLIYSAVELGFVTGYFICEIVILYTSDSEDIMMCIFALTFFWLSIFASFVFTLWNLRASEYRSIQSTYDFIENHDTRNLSMGRWTLLFGKNTFKKRFAIDRIFVRGLRAVLAIICLLAMITLAHLVLIVQPIQQEFYFQTMNVGEDFKYADGNVTLRVFLDIGTRNTEIFLVPELFDLDVSWLPETKQILCHDEYPGLNSVGCNVQSPFSQSPPDNLIIKVNYTRALEQVSIPSLRTGVHLSFNESDLFGDNDGLTPPIQLYPGFHLFGTTYYSYRDTYANSRDPTLGIPHYRRDLLLHVQALIPDPDFTNSNSDNTTATLRLTYQGGIPAVQSNYILHKAQSSTSVLSGFALLGGIWTFINGLFATVFGCSLLLVLFGIKPLSIYGLVHLFHRARSLVDSGGYTLSAGEQSRTIGVLREHLLDDDYADIHAGEVLESKDRDEEENKLGDIV